MFTDDDLWLIGEMREWPVFLDWQHPHVEDLLLRAIDAGLIKPTIH